MYLSLVFVWRYKSNKEGVNWFFFKSWTKEGWKFHKICHHPLPPLVEPAWLWYSDIPELRNRKETESGLPTPQEFKTPTWKRVNTWFSLELLLQPAWPQEPTGQWRHFMTSIHCWRKYFEKNGFTTIGVFYVWGFSIFNTYFSHIWDILSPLLWVCEMCCCTWRDNGRVNKVHYRWADLAAGSSFPKGPALPWKPVWPTYNCLTSIFSSASFWLFCSLGISRYVLLIYKPNCARSIEISRIIKST